MLQRLLSMTDIEKTRLVDELHKFASAQYKILTMPQTQDVNGNVAYTGFSKDLNAQSSEAKWTVKKQLQDGTETWAGKATFGQILDNYLTLSYN